MKLNIYKAVNDYTQKRPKRFHMPGHKANKNFNKMFRQAKIDITELAFSDNLASPCGVISQAEKDIANVLNAKDALILTDGSTSGIYTMLKAVSGRGKKIIICRNSHKSVYNACEILSIEPYVLNHNYKHGVVLPPSLEEIENLLKRNNDAIGVLVTSPDYYGNIVDLKGIKELTTRYKKLLLVDGAHGSHLAYNKGDSLAVYAGLYADIWVDGVHKTLPALTQGAILLTQNEKLIASVRESADYFRTSSPSYPIMASVEYSVKYMAENGKLLLDELKETLSGFKKRLRFRKFDFYKSQDFLKLAVDFKPTNIDPVLAEKYLISKGFYAELNDNRYILFYLSPMTKKSELNKLEKALKRLQKIKKLKNTYIDKPKIKTGSKSFSYLVASGMDKTLVTLDKSLGKICGKNTGIFPPCFPVVVAGEEITQETIELLKASSSTFGLVDGKMQIIK